MKLRNRKTTLAALLVTAAFSTFTALAADELESESRQAVASFQQKDPGLKTFFDQAAGYAIFPSVGKGGFIVGGAHGKGLVYEKGTITGKASMSQASVGAQVGGQSFSEIIFFENAAALDDFKAGKFEMSAGISAVVAAEGASQTAKYTKGVAVFALPKKGLMAEASVGGQKFKFEPSAAGKPGTSQGTETTK